MKNGTRIALALVVCVAVLVFWMALDRNRRSQGGHGNQENVSARVTSGSPAIDDSNDSSGSPLLPEELQTLKRNRVEGVVDSIYSQVEAYGHVVSASQPTTRLAGVLLAFNPAEARTRTDSQGFYSVQLSAPALYLLSYSMEADSDGEEPRLFPTDSWLNVDGAEKRKRHDLALPARGYLRLRVRAPNGQPAPAAPLEITRKTHPLSVGWSGLEVDTDSAGIWEGSLPAGPYSVTSWSKDSGLFGRLDLAVAGNSNQQDTLQLSKSKRVARGRVFDSKSGLGIAQARLRVLRSDQSHPPSGVVSFSYSTDDRGEFTVPIDPPAAQEDLPASLLSAEASAQAARQAGGRQEQPEKPTSFYLQARAKGYLPANSDFIDPPASAFDLGGIEIPLTPGQTVSGRVVDRNGTPVAGAEVSIRRLGTSGSLKSTTIRSDPEGRFVFEALEPGEFRLKASHSLGVSEELLIQLPVEAVVLELRPAGTLNGNVTWPNGEPVTDPFSLLLIRDVESFSIDNLTFYPHLFQDSQGKFELSRMLPGRYTLEAWVQVLDENTGDMTRLDGKSDPFEMKESGTPKALSR